MTKYVKKRIPVEAFHFDPQITIENWGPGGDITEKWANLIRFTDNCVRWTSALDTEDGVTLYEVYDYLHNTWVKFEEGAWIIKGVRGEFYSCGVLSVRGDVRGI